MHKVNSSHKFIALDALRGIAAVMVIFQHFWEMSNPSDARLKPWLLFCAGHEAVILFFVLSGFVLAHQIRGYELSDYGEFIVRRVLRIYPAYYLALLLSAVLLIFIKTYYPATLSGHGLTNWFYIWSQTSFDNSMIFGSLSLVSHEGSSLNMAVWSLFYEMWISALFPFVIYGLWRSNLFIRFCLILMLSFISWKFWQGGQILNNPWQCIIYYLWYFILGAILYYYHSRIKFLANGIVLVLALGLYFSNYLLYGKITDRLLHEVIIAIGCFFILLNGLHNKKMQKFLDTKVFQFYGKISYSLYLFHLPVLYGLSYWLLRKHDIILVKVLTIPIATLIAWMIYNLVELNGIKLAKKCFNK